MSETIFQRISIQRYRTSVNPGLRGALFYLAYWGIAGVYMPFVNIAFVRQGLSGREVGMLAALLPLMTLLAAPPIAMLADRRAWRVRFVVVALAGLAAALMLLGLGKSFLTLLPLMFLVALFRSPIAPLGDGLVVRMASRHGIDFGKLRLWGSLGFAIVAIASGWLWEWLGFDWMFLLAGALFVPVMLPAALLEERPPNARAARTNPRAIMRDPELLAVLSASFLMGAAIGMDMIFEGIAMDLLGGGERMVGLMLGLSALSELPAMHFGATIARRFGGRRALSLAYGVSLVAFVGFAFATNPWWLLVVGSLRGAGFGLFFVSTVQVIDERVPEEMSASVQAGMNAAAWGLAPLIAGPLSGMLFDVHGIRAVFLVCALAAAASIVVLLLFSRSPRRVMVPE